MWKTDKHLRRTHKERAQPRERTRFGLLEKHKDYKKRADDWKRKKRRIEQLEEKAAFRNPDEFHLGMINAQTQEGIHALRREAKPKTPKEMKTLTAQDASYLNAKLQTEKRKLDRLQSSLHGLADIGKPQNKHTIFVDSPQDVKRFKPAEYFNTDPSLVRRAYNRPTLDQLAEDTLVVGETGAEGRKAGVTASVRRARESQYRELDQRQARKRKLEKMLEKVETKRKLLDGGKVRKYAATRRPTYDQYGELVHEEKASGGPYYYKWAAKRQE
eukprot:TRINITY_DN8296_c0_g1_i1.p1 TRINITY_DN8296_c0_g1~~TRINITY_DN8296_c0_g1_i1.p1  ORF type:complete len:272 (-),score=71.55 TRINITY_DN8296_c0_g1_i1:16-831(-)